MFNKRRGRGRGNFRRRGRGNNRRGYGHSRRRRNNDNKAFFTSEEVGKFILPYMKNYEAIEREMLTENEPEFHEKKLHIRYQPANELIDFESFKEENLPKEDELELEGTIRTPLKSIYAYKKITGTLPDRNKILINRRIFKDIITHQFSKLVFRYPWKIEAKKVLVGKTEYIVVSSLHPGNKDCTKYKHNLNRNLGHLFEICVTGKQRVPNAHIEPSKVPRTQEEYEKNFVDMRVCSVIRFHSEGEGMEFLISGKIDGFYENKPIQVKMVRKGKKVSRVLNQAGIFQAFTVKGSVLFGYSFPTGYRLQEKRSPQRFFLEDETKLLVDKLITKILQFKTGDSDSCELIFDGKEFRYVVPKVLEGNTK